MTTHHEYKTTDIGVVPAEWEVKLLGELVVDGPKSGYSGQSAPQARGTLTLRLSATTAGYLVLNDETTKRLQETIPIGSDLFLRPGDLLVQRSNTADLVGMAAMFDGPANTYAYPDLMMRLRFHDVATAHWVWRYLNSTVGRRFFSSAAAGSTGTMPKISTAVLRGMKVPLPSHAEQVAIMSILADVENHIRLLEAQSVKKRDLKQAAMQQLLGGSRRLPPFCEPWQQVTGAELGDFFSGTGFALAFQGSPSGDYPFFKVSDMNNDSNATFMFSSRNWISETQRRLLGAPVLPAGSIVFAKVGGAVFLERKRILAVPSCVDNNMAALVTRGDRFHSKFVYYLLLNTKLSSLVSTTALPSIGRREFHRLSFTAPSVSEQHAIAEVLSDMDAEIAALEARLEKTRALKQGMMQELLTGRTRLV